MQNTGTQFLQLKCKQSVNKHCMSMYSMLQNEICHLNILAIHVDAIVANIGLLINKHLTQTIRMPFFKW